MTVTKERATKLPKLTEGKIIVVPHNLITRNFNIRTPANVRKVDNLLPSIEANGVLDPIKLTLSGVNIDGARRLHCLDILAEKRGVPGIDVAVLPVGIEENEIPLYQYNTFLRTGVTTREKNAAIYEHVLRNPNERNVDIADKFGVSKGVINSVTRIIRATDDLTNLVIEDEIGQNAALCIIDSVLKSRPIDEIEDADRTAITAITKIIKPAISAAKEEAEKNSEEFKPWNIRNVNQCLANFGLDPLPTTKSEKGDGESDGSGGKIPKLKDLQEELFKCLQFTPTPDGLSYQVSGVSNKTSVDYIMGLLANQAKGTIKEFKYTAKDLDEGLWSIWANKNKTFNGVVFIQITGNKIVTFDEDINYCSEFTSVKPVEELGGKSLYLTKSEFTSLVRDLIDKGVDIAKFTKEKPIVDAVPKIKGKKSKQPKDVKSPISTEVLEQVNSEFNDKEIEVNTPITHEEDLGLSISPEDEEKIKPFLLGKSTEKVPPSNNKPLFTPVFNAETSESLDGMDELEDMDMDEVDDLPL